MISYRFYRHNTLRYDFSPQMPEEMNWSELYPEKQPETPVEFVDIGCGYGGLLITLSPLFPNVLILGMEIRVKVSDYVTDRISALRRQNPGSYRNIACLRTNAMKYLPNYFKKGQVILHTLTLPAILDKYTNYSFVLYYYANVHRARIR